jgi:sodium-coupled neutral amino acid transporter 9
MIDEDSAEVQVQIGILEAEKYIPQAVKNEKISNLRKSLIVEQGGDSSFKVVTSIANTMIGSSIIVYPIVFIQDGMLGSLLVLLAIGAALYFTCRLLVLHNRHDEADFGQSIRRILGPKWARLNSVVNITLIYVVSIVYFMLICGNFFDITAAIFTELIDGYTPPKGKSIDLSKYSPQYACLICMLFTAPLICKRDIELLMKFFKFTIYLVFTYGIFILVALIKAFANDEIHFAEQYTLFNPDFSTVAGAFALSLLLHPVAAPILKRNANQGNNMRDLFFGYVLTALIYVYVGFIGGLTCASSAIEIQDS